MSDSSEFISDISDDSEVEEFLSQANLNASHNDSFGEQKALSPEQIFDQMQSEIEKVCEVTNNLSEAKARSLLNQYKWDSEKLLEVIFDGGKKARELLKDSWQFVPVDMGKSLDCGICFDTVDEPDHIQIFPCNHRFCFICLTMHVKITITENGGLLSTSIICPGVKCLFEISDKFVLELLKDSELKLLYQKIIARSFVENNRLIKWCPGTDCLNAVFIEPHQLTSQLLESVGCSCGCWFCFSCLGLSHDPVPCSMLLEWAKVKAEDLEAHHWIVSNTKPCPQCKINIQKNGGCMHMSCSKCRHQFCWVCMKSWSNNHHCLPDDTVPPAVGIVYIRRFLGYNTKHEHMKQSYHLDQDNYKKKELGTELELATEWIKIEFIAKAIQVLMQCRRTLMHSYIFSYFMTTIDNQMFMFELNLKYLEQSTEALSEILEHDVNAKTIGKLKEKIIDRSAVCKKQRSSLINHIKEGYEKKWWRKFPIPANELAEAEASVGDEVFQQLIY